MALTDKVIELQGALMNAFSLTETIRTVRLQMSSNLGITCVMVGSSYVMKLRMEEALPVKHYHCETMIEITNVLGLKDDMYLQNSNTLEPSGDLNDAHRYIILGDPRVGKSTYRRRTDSQWINALAGGDVGKADTRFSLERSLIRFAVAEYLTEIYRQPDEEHRYLDNLWLNVLAGGDVGRADIRTSLLHALVKSIRRVIQRNRYPEYVQSNVFDMEWGDYDGDGDLDSATGNAPNHGSVFWRDKIDNKLRDDSSYINFVVSENLTLIYNQPYEEQNSERAIVSSWPAFAPRANGKKQYMSFPDSTDGRMDNDVYDYVIQLTSFSEREGAHIPQDHLVVDLHSESEVHQVELIR